MSVRHSGFILILPSTTTPSLRCPRLYFQLFLRCLCIGLCPGLGRIQLPPNSPWAHVSEVNLGVAPGSPADIQFNEPPGACYSEPSASRPRAEGTGSSRRAAFPAAGPERGRGSASKGALLAVSGASHSPRSPLPCAGRLGPGRDLVFIGRPCPVKLRSGEASGYIAGGRGR